MNIIRINDIPAMQATGDNVLTTSRLDGYSVHALHFLLAAGGGTLTKAQISNITIKVGGVTIIDGITGTQLQSINSHKGLNSDASRLSFYFGDPDAVSFRDKHLNDLDLSVYKGDNNSGDPGNNKGAAPVEIHITTNGATAPTCWVEAEVYAPKSNYGFDNKHLSFTKRYFRSVLTPAVANGAPGQDQIINQGAKVKAAVLAQYWFHANLTSVEWKRDGKVLRAPLTVAQSASLLLDKGHPTQAGMYVILPTYEGHLDSAELTNGTFEHLLVNSAADNISVFVETMVSDLNKNVT